MTTVWVVTVGMEDFHIQGIFSDADKALASIAQKAPTFKQRSDEDWIAEEFTVDGKRTEGTILWSRLVMWGDSKTPVAVEGEYGEYR